MRMLLWTAAFLLFAQLYPGQHATKENQANNQSAIAVRVSAEMKTGESANAKQDYATAMNAYREAIGLDPQNADAHKHFIEASMNQANRRIAKLFQDPNYRKFERGELHGQAKKTVEMERKKANAERKTGNDALLATYDGWIAAHPRVAVFYWAKGYALTSLEKTTGEEELFQKAISLDPKFVPAYNSMADLEFSRGDYAKQREYLKHAMDLEPTNPEALRAYAETFQFSNPVEFRQLAENFASQFPQNSYCPYLLYQLENAEPATADRIALLERIRRTYVDTPVSTAGMDEPDVFTNWIEESMADLFNLYALNSPRKALDLAQEMQKQKWADTGWKDAVVYQQNLTKALDLISATKYSEASALLQRQFGGFIVKYYLDRAPLVHALAEAQAGAGNVQQAFDTLAAAWIKSPNVELKAGLLKYGSRLGKNAQQVDAALWQKWTANAKQMKLFELKKAGEKGRIKLSDFRGRVVLVSFWFPLCGPCRQEMPYFGEVAKKYQSQGFVILAINGLPEQNSLAPGILKNYDIVGLKVSSDKWAKQYDNVQGYPTNYLIDAEGRIMAHPRVYSGETLQELETQINVLVAHSRTDKEVNSGERAKT